MSSRTRTQNDTRRHHVAANSIDTNASGLAESAISFSAFPEPPASIPSTPRSAFTFISSNSRQSPVPSYRPLRPNRKKSSSLAKSTATAQPAAPAQVPDTPYSRPYSSHDWHEGASSIDVDPTEDRLLSTSFITSLLQESSDGASTRRSMHSDAISAFSEMTYPPPSRQFISASPVPSTSTSPTTTSTRSPTSHKYPSQRPAGSRPPPSSVSPIPEATHRQGTPTDDADTFDSSLDKGPTVIRSASRSGAFRSPMPVVGVAPATIRSLSGVSGQSSSAGYAGVLEPHDEEEDNLMDNGSPRGNSQNFLRDPSTVHNSQSRQSFHSSKSFATSVISRISAGVARAMPWRKSKPLPQVPPVPRIPISVENPNPEAEVPLSGLATRASTLNDMLEKGYHPHHSLNSYYAANKDETQASGFTGLTSPGEMFRRPAPPNLSHSAAPGGEGSKRSRSKPLSSPNKRRYCIILAVFIIIAGVAVGAGVGVSLSRKDGGLPKCAGQNTGMSCDLDATCTCTSDSGSCNALAKSLADTIPLMNMAFNTSYTLSSAYSVLWQIHAVSSDNNCVSQALLIDAAPGVKYADSPRRTEWTRSALLWNLLKSQDTDAVKSMRDGISKAPWSSIAVDGAVEDKENKFAVTASGYTFNFASQTVSPTSVTYFNNGQPVDTQFRRVGGSALDALNRMYSYAFSSSKQQQNALSSYWTNILLQRIDDLPQFKSAIISSSILIPFDATSTSLTSLMSNDSNSPFPPPLSCYSGLNQSVMDRIGLVEQGIFGLSAPSAVSRLDTSCFPDRPIYGVLDVLRLRLPFIDSRTGTAKQAAVLRRDAGSRAVLYSGELLSPFPLSSNSTPFILNPREHGTTNNVNHVILNYLTSISDTNLARDLVKFVMNSNRDAPPSSDSSIVQSLAGIPPIEVAIFGSVLGSDVSSVVSSFSTPSGTMFFGSGEAQTMRQWSINALSSGGVRWVETALSTEVARDTTFDDSTFNDIWRAAATALETNASNVGVKNVTDSLRSTGKFSSS
ncbi:hypothetical protein PM082_002882 [Marasmius tenuissimus]|nr:hypothetical protein PM082_002882 [Marasmius tenuissimus]